MRRYGTPLSLIALAVVSLPLPVASQNLQNDFVLESRLLDRDLELYGEARIRERQAIGELRELSAQLDSTLADPNVPLSELRRQETLLSAGRETAFLRAKETSDIRFRIYDRMERLTQLALDVSQILKVNVGQFNGLPDRQVDVIFSVLFSDFGDLLQLFHGHPTSRTHQPDGKLALLALFDDTAGLEGIEVQFTGFPFNLGVNV